MQEEDKKIIDDIQRCFQSKEYHELKALSERKTLLDIFGKSRSETIYSAMIGWCFDNIEFKNTPEPSILFLLRLAALKAEYQATASMPRDTLMGGDLWKNIFVNNINNIDVEEVTLEEQTKTQTSRGRSDISIKCIINKEKIRILIENKVDSSEHNEQCLKYVDFYENNNDPYNTVYLFLAPDEPEKLSSDKFIKITYQDFLDSVLYPIMSYRDQYLPKTVFYLEEFINTITSFRTEKNNRILAMSEEVKSLLKEFFKNNRDLIFAAIDSVSDGDEELKEKANKVREGTVTYTITFPDLTKKTVSGHTALAYDIAQYLATKYSKQYLLNKYGRLETTCSDKDFILGQMKQGKNNRKLYTGEAIISKGGGKVWCSNQWIPEKVEILKDAINNEDIKIS